MKFHSSPVLFTTSSFLIYSVHYILSIISIAAYWNFQNTFSLFHWLFQTHTSLRCIKTFSKSFSNTDGNTPCSSNLLTFSVNLFHKTSLQLSCHVIKLQNYTVSLICFCAFLSRRKFLLSRFALPLFYQCLQKCNYQPSGRRDVGRYKDGRNTLAGRMTAERFLVSTDGSRWLRVCVGGGCSLFVV